MCFKEIEDETGLHASLPMPIFLAFHTKQNNVSCTATVT